MNMFPDKNLNFNINYITM